MFHWMFWIGTLALAQDRTPWAAALATGDCTAAVSLLPAPVTSVERLAKARCLEELGQPGAALELLVEPIEPALAPYAKLVQARAWIARTRPVEAARALEGVSLPGDEEALLRGKALVLAGDSLQAREGLRAILGGPLGDEARYWLARGAEERGEFEPAIATWRALWAASPDSPWAVEASRRLEALGKPVPDFSTPEGQALARQRAEALLARQAAAAAVPLIEGLQKAAPFTRREDQLFYARALFDARDYAGAVRWFEAAKAADGPPAVTFQYALATARAGDYDAAADRYRALIARAPNTPEADEARYKIPYMAFDAREDATAQEGFKHYLSTSPKGKFAADSRWFLSWSLFRTGRTSDARAAWTELIALHPSSPLTPQARYWLARTSDDLPGLRSLLHDAPDTGAAWFAAERLGVRFPKAPPVTPPTLPAAWLAARPQASLGLQLAQAGMSDWGAPLLEGVSAAATDRTTRLGLAQALVWADDFPAARAVMAPLCGEKDAVVTSLCKPRPHAGVVEPLAAAGGLHRLLPYAIMNAESGLDPRVTSPVGARGLMQLMPALGRELAGDPPGWKVDFLYRAGLNARLGTTALLRLHSRYKDAPFQPSLPLVIAAYNGSPEAVDRWLAAWKGPREIDRFAEEISYTETRRYVKRVLGFLMTYRSAYGDDT